jgi:hypothetical protein
MTTGFANQAAPAQASDASTYNGFYFRDNLASTGKVPAVSPFNLTPDIIQSDVPVPNATVAFSTIDSWKQAYPTEPTPGQNYYYLRGLNGALDAFDGSVRLYWAPSQLILFPSSWKNNPLSTQKGSEEVGVQADAGHIGVGSQPFLLNTGSERLPTAESFYAFVSQNTASAVPTISSWLEMSQLLTQQLGFGFRNMVSFDPVAGPMLYRLGFDIPMSVGESATLQIGVSVQGIPAGDTVGLITDCYTPEMTSIALLPTKTNGDGYVAGIQVNVDPGFNASIAVQYWNTSGKVPPAGSQITVTANYVIPEDKFEKALTLGVLESRYAQAGTSNGVGPQQIAPVGAVTFVTTSAS